MSHSRISILLVGLLLFTIGSLNLKELFAASPPNVVLIISDDQFADDFGFMGNEQVSTPHLDQLAAKSARFVNGSVPTSVCSPSLATILTGLYPHQHGIHFNHPPPGNGAFNRMNSKDEYRTTRQRSFEIIKNQETLPRVLHRESNYQSLQTGKFWEGHFRNAGFTDGMTIFEPVPGQTFGGNRKLASGELQAHGNGDWGLKIGRETMQPIADFLDDVERDPFLIWYAPYLPHQPHDSPQKFYDLYETNEDLPKHRIPYYAAISQFDETVGELVKMIESRGLAEKTLFVFVIDNGWEASEVPQRNRPEEYAHTKNSKRSPFEPGLRTPILLRWDNMIQPMTFPEPVSSIDIAPTIYAACEVPQASKELPGINLLLAATGKETLDPHRSTFGEIYPGDASSLGHPERDIAYRWMKQDEYKLIVPHRRHGKSWNSYLDRGSLFNLKKDPQEQHNIIDSPENLKRFVSLYKQLQEWWDGNELTQN